MKHIRLYNEATTASLKLSAHESLIDYIDDVFLDLSDKGSIVSSYYKYSNESEFYACDVDSRNSDVTWGELRDILLTLVSYFDELMIRRYSIRINGDGYRSIEEYEEHMANNMELLKLNQRLKIRNSSITFWVKRPNP